jgi:hypothetical protein
MTDSNSEKLTAVWADVSERLEEYVAVWRDAIDRNAADAYAADDWLCDLQTLWGMSVRDAARVSAAVIDAITPLLAPDDDDGGEPAAPG